MRVIDLAEFSYEDLVVLIHTANEEKRRRDIISSAEIRAEEIVEEYSRAVGRKDGDVWTPPIGAHDSFRMGARVFHNGVYWISTIPNNVWEPGVSGWVGEAVEDEDTGKATYPKYRQPTGANDAYKVGDRITWTDGKVYESNRDGNVWDPDTLPSGWNVVE